MNTITQISTLFFPPDQKDTAEISFKDAIQDLTTQRVARVAKAIFFTISSIAATVSLVLTESGVITWPLALPAILTTLIAGLIFYRLNSLDSQYVERLNDATRESCAKKELERIFLSREIFSPETVTNSLKGVNRLLGLDIFNREAIDNILCIQRNADFNAAPKSIGEMALEQNRSIAITLGADWFEQGRFGLPSYELSVGVNWTGILEDPIVVKYHAKEKTEGTTETTEGTVMAN